MVSNEREDVGNFLPAGEGRAWLIGVHVAEALARHGLHGSYTQGRLMWQEMLDSGEMPEPMDMEGA